MRRLAGAVLVLSMSCASAKVRYLDPHPLPPRAESSVVFLTDEPATTYKVIALIEAGNGGWDVPREKLQARLVSEAARLGGEAVILCAEKRESTFVWTYVPLGVAGNDNRTTLVAKVVVFAKP